MDRLATMRKEGTAVSEMTPSELNVLARRSGESMRCRMVIPHPACAKICADNFEWAKRFELVSNDAALNKLADIGCGVLAAYTYPRASEEQLSIAADLLAWFFPFDDQYGEGCPCESLRMMKWRFASYVEAARSGKPPSKATPFHRAMVDICDRARAIASDPDCWSERFANNLGAYFDGCLLEQTYRRSTEIPNVDEYRRIRALSIGSFPMFELIPLAGANLSTGEFDNPTMSRLRTSASLLIVYCNDIYSFAKEKKDGAGMNLVTVLASEFELSIRGAMDGAVQLYNAELARFEKEMTALNGAGTSVLSYIQGLEEWVQGHVAWTRLSGRFACSHTSEPAANVTTGRDGILRT